MKKTILLILSLILFYTPVFAKEKIQYTNDTPGIYVFKINTKKYGTKIKPYVASSTRTTRKVYDDNCFDLVVNGGFFDVKNGKSVSYVTIDNNLVYDIENYEKFIQNLKNEQRHKLKFDIARHNAPVKKGWKIKHSLQAGPILYPEMDLNGEGFVVYEDGMVKAQYADILKRRERTAVGLKGKYLYIVIFSKEHKLDVNELRDYMINNLKVKKILALDGGLSTSLNYKDISIGSLGKRQRRVKSFLVIER